MQDLAGKIAVVTGGGSGIGRGIALAAAAEGMHVVLADIEQGPAADVAREVSASEVETLAVQANVADPDSVKALADQVFDRFGSVHLLCNNAGVFTLGDLADASQDDWRWVMDVNVMGVVNGLQAFLPRMRAQDGESHIVNTGSLAGLMAPRGLPIGVYTASKYAVVAISETLRMELEADQVGVSVLCPGGVQTRIWEAERNRPDSLGGPQPIPEPVAAVAQEAARGGGGAAMDPEQVGRIVIAVVKADSPYIITHPETRGLVARRFEAIMAAFDQAG